MDQAMLPQEMVCLPALPTQHRVLSTSRTALFVVFVLVDLVGMGLGRVETDRQMVFGPEAVETMEDGRGTAAEAAEIAAVAEECDGSGSGSEDAPACERSRCEVEAVGPWRYRGAVLK